MLNGQTAIVTGAARGIGRAVSSALLDQGVNVSLVDRDPRFPEEFKGASLLPNSRYLALAGDASNSHVIRSVVSQTSAKWNKIDILVNNVGGSIGVKGFEITEGAWDRTLDLNLKSAFLFCKEVAPFMRRQGSGRIINISSSGGRYRSNTGASNVAYAAAKAGMLQLTRTSAHALGPYGITVNAIAPGLVLSDAGLAELESLAPEVRARVLLETPLGYFPDPAEIASIAVFLASKDASYVTGATILANGGWCTS